MITVTTFRDPEKPETEILVSDNDLTTARFELGEILFHTASEEYGRTILNWFENSSRNRPFEMMNGRYKEIWKWFVP